MDDIVLSAGVRQNLLALQNTAHLMSLTQNRLATGKKVNTAEDNPISFFTSQALQSRAGDFNSLLDSIGQAQQVLSTANQGITSLSKLVQSGISTAIQAQQSPIGYTTKSNLSTTIGGATALDLRGTTTYISAAAMSNVLYTGAAGGTTAATSITTLGGTIAPFTGSVVQDNTAAPANITIATALYGPSGGGAGTGGLTTQAATGYTDGSDRRGGDEQRALHRRCRRHDRRDLDHHARRHHRPVHRQRGAGQHSRASQYHDCDSAIRAFWWRCRHRWSDHSGRHGLHRRLGHDRQWPYHHLQDSGSASCCRRSDRLRRQRQHCHRRQRQLHRLSRHRHTIERHRWRPVERHRSCQQREERRYQWRRGH